MPKGVFSNAHRRMWSPEDRFEVEDGIARGLTYAQIAKRTNRSTNSVKVFCSRNLRCGPLRPLSARAVGRMLGVSCSKTVARWAEDGWMRGKRGSLGAGKNRRWVFEESAVHAFMEAPEHWHRWDAERVADPDLREWAQEIRREQYLTQAEVAERFFVVTSTVAQWIDKGYLPCARNGNRTIPASALAGFVPPSARSKAGGTARRFTPAENARLLELRNGGASWSECEYQLHRSIGSCAGRYARLSSTLSGRALS